MKKIILLPLLLVSVISAWAHALYIDTKAAGQKGKAHEVKIYYGEYADGKPETLAHWYSDMKAFTIWLVTPGNQRVQLKTDSATDHFLTSFTPEEEGAYQLVISHSAKDLGKTTLYQFNTQAIVTVGKPAPVQPANQLSFTVDKKSAKDEVKIAATYKGEPCDKCKVTIISPTGWTKEITPTAGAASFQPEGKGKYMIEVTRMDKETGEHHGKTFESIWRCATMLVELN